MVGRARNPPPIVVPDMRRDAFKIDRSDGFEEGDSGDGDNDDDDDDDDDNTVNPGVSFEGRRC